MKVSRVDYTRKEKKDTFAFYGRLPNFPSAVFASDRKEIQMDL